MRLALITATVALITALLTGTGGAAADHQIQFCDASYGCYDQYSSVVRELRTTGVHRWRYVQEGNADLLGPVVTALQEYSDEFGLLMQHDPVSGYRQIASGGTAFIYGNATHDAGGSWAIGIVSGFLSSREAAVYDAQTMAAWPERSKVEVALHEDGHMLMTAGEGYKHDLASPCNVYTNAFNRSFMGCGLGNAQEFDDFVRGIWASVHGPGKPVSGVGVNAAGHYIFHCGASAKATRTALMAYHWPSGSYRWTSETHVIVKDGNGCQGFLVDHLLGPDECPGVNVENGASTMHGRADVVLC